MSEGRVEKNVTTSGRLHEPVLSTQQNEALLSRKHANEGGNMRGTNMPGRSSGEGVQRQGSRLESTQLGDNRGRTELYRQRQTIPHNRGNQRQVSQTNSVSQRCNFTGGLLRAWDSAKNKVEGATLENLFDIRDRTIEEVVATIDSDKLSVKDKEDIILSFLWQAKELDKKFNIPYEGSLMRVIYEGDIRNLEETLAYTLQGNLAPVHTGALFEFVFNVFNLIESLKENKFQEYLSFSE